MNPSTQVLLNQLIENMFEERKLEKQFVDLLGEINTDLNEIKAYLRSTLQMHPDRPANMHVRLVDDYCDERQLMADLEHEFIQLADLLEDEDFDDEIYEQCFGWPQEPVQPNGDVEVSWSTPSDEPAVRAAVALDRAIKRTDRNST